MMKQATSSQEFSGHTHLGYLGFKDVSLVEEQNYGGFQKPPRINDRFEQYKRFSHSILESANEIDYTRSKWDLPGSSLPAIPDHIRSRQCRK